MANNTPTPQQPALNAEAFLAQHVTPVPASECPICKLPYGLDDTVTTSHTSLAHSISPCTHTFCRPCIEQWVRAGRGSSNQCPVCRTTLFEQPRRTSTTGNNATRALQRLADSVEELRRAGDALGQAAETSRRLRRDARRERRERRERRARTDRNARAVSDVRELVRRAGELRRVIGGFEMEVGEEVTMTRHDRNGTPPRREVISGAGIASAMREIEQMAGELAREFGEFRIEVGERVAIVAVNDEGELQRREFTLGPSNEVIRETVQLEQPTRWAAPVERVEDVNGTPQMRAIRLSISSARIRQLLQPEPPQGRPGPVESVGDDSDEEMGAENREGGESSSD